MTKFNYIEDTVIDAREGSKVRRELEIAYQLKRIADVLETGVIVRK